MLANFMDALNGTEEMRAALNLTNLKNLENILGNFKQTLISSVEVSFSVFYSLVSSLGGKHYLDGSSMWGLKVIILK